jgi:hypothetical protein
MEKSVYNKRWLDLDNGVNLKKIKIRENEINFKYIQKKSSLEETNENEIKKFRFFLEI